MAESGILLSLIGRTLPPEARNTKKRPLQQKAIGVSELKPGSVLLSHGEAPHYHRRYVFSLLSSEWIQVVPTRYCRQANGLPN